ncbi:MAG: SpoIIE family protein phosphatase [Acidobacteria bacterium]|nr:SpoIIE family protein phosphatase [Acidobacteriota bacterium]
MTNNPSLPLAAARPAGNLGLLSDALGALRAGADPDSLARQVVEAAGRFGLSGARLWRQLDSRASVWQESGKMPAPDVAAAAHALAGKPAAGGSVWVHVFGGDGPFPMVLEAAPAQPLDNDARAVLALFARFAGTTLAGAESRRSVETLSSIVEATKQLNSTLDLGELINIVLQLATRETGADRGTVFLVDKEHEEIWSLVGLGLAQQEIRIPMTKGIAGHVARTGETINLLDAYEDARFEPDVDRRLGYRTRTLLCLPILNKDNEIVGVLQLLNKATGPFSTEDTNFLRALSIHCAIAIENAQLHRELLNKQRLERDLALARSIQRGLLPEHPPAIDGFDIVVSHKPSQMVGGDYYDFIPLSPQALLLVIADVEGKGVASALVMANLQATLRALVVHLHSLERIVASVNDMILADTRAQKYMSMFVGLLDQRNRTFHYINAGHVPPAVVRANGEHVFLREGGMVVGIFPGVAYERGYLKLEPGDVFVGCTDGITEAMDVQSNEYGIERLVETIGRERNSSAERIVETVLSEVDRFSRGGPHEDDRIIMVLKAL